MTLVYTYVTGAEDGRRAALIVRPQRVVCLRAIRFASLVRVGGLDGRGGGGRSGDSMVGRGDKKQPFLIYSLMDRQSRISFPDIVHNLRVLV